MTQNISVLIPSYNGLWLLEKNLPSVLNAAENSKNKIIEIVVIDDGSTDGTSSFLKKNFPGVRVIKHSKNRGFSASINTGVRMAKGELVVLLNNDVNVTKNFLVKAGSHFDAEDVFAVSFHEEGYGGSKGKFKNGFIVHEGQKESDKVTNTFWANGGSSLVKRRLFLDLGGLDEDLLSPFYWEDIDLSYRALKRGYKILWEPDSHVVHNHESTTGKIPKKYRQRIQERNQLRFIWKNLTSYSYLRRHLIGLINRIIRNPGYLIIFIMALPKIGVILKRRRKERKEAKVSDEAIFSSFK